MWLLFPVTRLRDSLLHLFGWKYHVDSMFWLKGRKRISLAAVNQAYWWWFIKALFFGETVCPRIDIEIRTIRVREPRVDFGGLVFTNEVVHHEPTPEVKEQFKKAIKNMLEE